MVLTSQMDESCLSLTACRARNDAIFYSFNSLKLYNGKSHLRDVSRKGDQSAEAPLARSFFQQSDEVDALKIKLVYRLQEYRATLLTDRVADTVQLGTRD